MPIEAERLRTTAGHRPARTGAALALLVTIAACSPQRASTPLPTRQTTIDPVKKKLEEAGAQAGKRREEMDGSQTLDDVGVFEQKVAGPGEHVPQQPGLPGSPRTGQHQGRKGLHGPSKLPFEVALDVPHR